MLIDSDYRPTADIKLSIGYVAAFFHCSSSAMPTTARNNKFREREPDFQNFFLKSLPTIFLSSSEVIPKFVVTLS